MSDYGNDDTLCTKCNKYVDTALLLQCNHNLCLPCACLSFLREEKYKSSTYHCIRCDICGQLTNIDDETAEQLILHKPEDIPNSQQQSPRGVIRVYYI